MLRRPRTLAAVVLAVVLTAIPSAASAAPRSLTSRANSALITTSELVPGWRVEPASAAPDTAAAPTDCFSGGSSSRRGVLVDVERDFSYPSTGELLSEQLEVFRTRSSALVDYVAGVRAAFACRAFTAEGVRWTQLPIRVVRTGDRTYAGLLTASVQGVPVTMYVFATLKGRHQVTTMTAAYGALTPRDRYDMLNASRVVNSRAVVKVVRTLGR